MNEQSFINIEYVIDGAFAITMLGTQGSSLATWIFLGGRFFGFDNRLGQYDGFYNSDKGIIRCSGKVKVPAGIPSIYQSKSDSDQIIDIDLLFNSSWETGRPFYAGIGAGIQMSATRIRNL